jgi:dTDP-4-dehydrorhamnose reductase
LQYNTVGLAPDSRGARWFGRRQAWFGYDLGVILVLGAGGLVGSHLCRLLAARGVPHARRSHTECDITVAAAVVALSSTGARAVVNCAAYNAVDRAESEPERAFAVNADGAGNVAGVAPFLLHYSTDFVFDGAQRTPYHEEDAPRPLSAYGRAKAAGDAAVLAANAKHLVMRVGCLYGRDGRGFGSTVLARLRRGERIRADGERRVQPSWVQAVAEQTATLVLLPSPPGGLVHAMCQGETTWAEFARELAHLGGLDADLVEAVPTAALAGAAPRPSYAVLANGRLEALGLCRMPEWRAALVGYLTEESKR